MKNIAIISANHFLPVPPIYGGACEELMKIIIDENEKNHKFNICYIQKKFDENTIKQLSKFEFKNTKMVFIKHNKFIDFFVRAINFGLKILKIKCRLPRSYDKNLLKYLKKNKFDKLVFEGGSPANINKLLKIYSRDQIYKHFHSQELYKPNESKAIGNIIGVSKFIVDDWIEFYKTKNIYNVSGYVLKNCVDENKFSKSISDEERENIRKQYGFKPSDFVIVFVGRLIEVKGIKELIYAISHLPENIKLLIVGSPNFKDKNRSPFLSELNSLTEHYSDKIKFTGFIENKNLYKYYMAADLHCVPSIWNDPAPLVIFEGMLSGLPQLVTKSGGIPEYICKDGAIVLDKNNKLIENLESNILKLSKDKQKLNEMGKANLEYSKKYKKAIYLEDFAEILNSK